MSRKYEAGLLRLKIQEEIAKFEDALSAGKELGDRLDVVSGELDQVNKLNAEANSRNKELKVRVKEVEEHRTSLEITLVNLENAVAGFKLSLQDKDIKIVLFLIEIERLHRIIIEHENDLETWRDRILEQEATQSTIISELKRKFETMLQERIVT